MAMSASIAGANEKDYHLAGIKPGEHLKHAHTVELEEAVLIACRKE
ncbi:hypothetical protein [Paenibacillus sp. sgz302251]